MSEQISESQRKRHSSSERIKLPKNDQELEDLFRKYINEKLKEIDTETDKALDGRDEFAEASRLSFAPDQIEQYLTESGAGKLLENNRRKIAVLKVKIKGEIEGLS